MVVVCDGSAASGQHNPSNSYPYPPKLNSTCLIDSMMQKAFFGLLLLYVSGASAFSPSMSLPRKLPLSRSHAQSKQATVCSMDRSQFANAAVSSALIASIAFFSPAIAPVDAAVAPNPYAKAASTMQAGYERQEMLSLLRVLGSWKRRGRRKECGGRREGVADRTR
eukprot:757022-Hanusia_phi.AAC.1